MAVMARSEWESRRRGRWGWTTPVSRRRAFGRRAGPGRTQEDAVRGRGPDRSRRPTMQGQAGPCPGLPQPRERTRHKAPAGPRCRGRDRRPRPCRPQPPGDPHRLRARCGPNGALQTGQHLARKHRERDHRNLPEARPQPCRTPSRQLRLVLQPPLPSPSLPDHDPALPAQCRPYTAHPLPRTNRRLTFADE